MAAQSNLDRVRVVYANWNSSKGGSVEEILDLFADDVEMRSALAADVPASVAGAHVKKAEARAYFEGLLRDWEMISYDVERYIVDREGDEIVMVGRCAFRNKATGQLLDTPKIDVCTFRDGKIVRFQESYDTLGFARAMGHA
ncbi:MAG TPA: nuclear transport factor 2 family protein [Allosphingosinicella sp.]|nr:nuclear transport factor 2 family protein [Allosphingosinicella sp.]